MKNFIKKQVDKIILYVLIVVILFLIGIIFNIQISILISTLSFITSIFAIILEKTWLEDYKNELNRELETHKAKLSGYTLVTKLQYDLEFKIYTEIVPLSVKYGMLIAQLIDQIERKMDNDKITEKIKNTLKMYDELENMITKYSPFYLEEISKNIIILLRTGMKIMEEANKYMKSSFCDIKECKINEKIMMLNSRKISDLIRERIENMKILD